MYKRQVSLMSAIGALHLPLIKASLRKVKDKRKVSLVNAGETQQHIANQGAHCRGFDTRQISMNQSIMFLDLFTFKIDQC